MSVACGAGSGFAATTLTLGAPAKPYALARRLSTDGMTDAPAITKPMISTNGTVINVSVNALGASTVERANVKASHAAMTRHAAVRARIHGGEMSRSRSSPVAAARCAARVFTSPAMTGFDNLAKV